MKRSSRLIPIAFVALLMLMQTMTATGPFASMGSDLLSASSNPDPMKPDTNDILLGPEENLYRFTLSDQGWTQWTGVSSPLTGNEYGNRSDTFEDRQMQYDPDGTTSDDSVSVPTGSGWEAYDVSVDITDLTENRTWITNPDFTGGDTDWTRATVGGGGNSVPSSIWVENGTGPGDDCLEFEVDSTTSGTYWYDSGDRGYATQTVNIPRGTVVWAGLRLSYWADTQDDTHYGMTGSFALYMNAEGNRIWYLVFDAIAAEETWYDTGLMFINPGVFNLPADQDVGVEIGLESTQPVGYIPEIGPRARVDKVELYLKTRATPSSVNLEMNGNSVSNNPGYGTGYITETPATPWTTDPVQLNFSWTPTPATPDPNRTVYVDYTVTTNMYARELGGSTVSEISPTAFGESFSIQNGTDATYTSYFYADIPSGYPRLYYFNLSLPSNRDVFFVASPLAPSTNLTTGWTGGATGDGYLNVTTYAVTTEAGRYGYWRIKSTSPNLISDLEIYDPNDTTWKPTVNLRAGNSSRIRIYVGPSYEDSVANITVFDPDGSKWYSETAPVDSSGYATSSLITFSGSTASAGSWMTQATVEDSGATGDWHSTGFFKRAFNVTHSSELIIDYPTDAVGTWTTNATYGDLLLIVMRANDTDSDVLVPGGTLTYNWAAGSDTFDDSGNGQYTKVFDTSDLPGKGQYVMSLTWTAGSHDTAMASLTINVNYAATLTSPDYPGISGPIGYDQTFTVDFANVNGTGIPSASLVCDWVGGYTVTPLGGGSYEFELVTTGVPIGQYPVVINASASYVSPESMLLYVEIREIYNSVSYSANELSIPVGEARSFQITWINTEDDTPVTDGVSYITCNWTSFHETGENNYTISHAGSGAYEVTIYTEDDDPLTTMGEFFVVTFTVERQDYQNHTFDIRVRIRSHNTLFILDEPVQQTAIGNTVTVLVFFQDTDLQVGITNITGNVQILVTSPTLGSVQFSVGSSSYGVGHYNISIPSGQWGSAGWKNLTIYANWIGAVQKYTDRTIDTRVRILGTDTDLFLEEAPTATYFLNDFTFTAVYYDVVNATNISNNTNNVALSITPLTGGHPVTQSHFTVVETGAGTGVYRFTLNSTNFQATGTFVFRLDYMWRKGVTPLYENQTMTVSLVVLPRPTYVDYIPVPATPYGEDAEFRFGYIDTLTATRIGEFPQLTISLINGTVSFTYSYDSGDTSFALSIDTATLPGIGTHVLVLNVTWVGSPFYGSVQSQVFTVTVVQRSTQLSHLSFVPGQWGNNVTIEFIYTDLISGSSAGMTGALTLNASLAGWYTISYEGSGHYLVVLNTSGVGIDGLYVITASIVHAQTEFADASESFAFSVLKRSTQIGYEIPDPAPYQENVSFVITYSDDSTARGISGATVTVDCSNSTSALVLDTNYWVTYQGSGQYMVEVSSVALGSLGIFVLNVTVDYSGAPYYLPASRDVISRVVERATQILLTQTPGETPFLEDILFRFRFDDYLTGSLITIDKTHITLTHGVSHTVIPSGSYVLFDGTTYYEITFNSSLLNPTALVTGHEIQLSIDDSAGAPYYAVRSTTTSATTIERPTQILFPLVEEVPYHNNITIELDYVDFLSSHGIEGANIVIASTNWTVAQYQVEEIGGGLYRIYINSTVFGGTGTVFFDITASKGEAPFYATRFTTGVPASIRPIIMTLQADPPAPGSTAVGVPIVVLLTLTNFDHGGPLEGATITTDWTTLYGTPNQLVEVGGGVYNLTLDMTGLLAQDYPFSVQAQKLHYQTSSILVSVTPGASTFTIVLARTAVFAQWGEVPNIRLDLRESYYYSLVPGANVTLYWNGTPNQFDDLGNGTYSLDLDTTASNFGIYDPQISVSKQYYQTRQTTITLVVSKAPGHILSLDPDSGEVRSFHDVIISTATDVVVYLNDTIRGDPVVGASVAMEWNNTIYPLIANGTPGFYVSTLDFTGFQIGPYELVMSAASTNHVFLDTVVDINVVPIPTEVRLTSGATALFVVRGDTLRILVEYNDTHYGGYVLGANVTYTLGSLAGTLNQEANGTYSAIIDTSDLPAQSIFLRVTGAKGDYATTTRTLVVTIQPVPTSVTASPLLRVGYHTDIVDFIFYYNDTHSSSPIVGAFVSVQWDGGAGDVTDYGNGSYLVEITLSPISPRLYDISVRFTLQNYTTASVLVRVVITATPAQIVGPSSFDVPVNHTSQVIFDVVNTLTDEIVPGLNGIAYWEGAGEVPLISLENGSYALEVLDVLPEGLYRVEIGFSTSVYSLVNVFLDLEVRLVLTSLIFEDLVIDTFPGGTFSFEVEYRDSDHGTGISGAIPVVDYFSENLTYYPDRMNEVEPGVYRLEFFANTGGTFEVTVTFAKDLHETQVQTFMINSDFSDEQIFTRNLTMAGGFIFIFLAIGIVAYVKHFSIPKMIRILNKMIAALASRKIPKAASVPTREETVLLIVNEELSPSGLTKTMEDIPGPSIEAVVPEVEDLLEHLAAITGLDDSSLEAFRQDLARMKASERPGFIREVIEQEEARRADVLVEEVDKKPEEAREILEEKPEELEELKTKLRRKGMSDDEIDIIIEQAKGLSKADLEALLDSLGIRL